jgi:transcription antitermination factor NusG
MVEAANVNPGAVKMKFHFEVGDPVRIIDGTFAGFDTVVESQTLPSARYEAR